MAEVERDVPGLDELVIEIDANIARLDNAAGEITAASVMSELKNTILPLMKDIASSAGLGFEEIQDIIEPIKLTGASAQNIGELLQGFKAASPGNANLHGRIDEALVDLEQMDPPDEDEDDEETN